MGNRDLSFPLPVKHIGRIEISLFLYPYMLYRGRENRDLAFSLPLHLCYRGVQRISRKLTTDFYGKLWNAPLKRTACLQLDVKLRY